MANNNNSKTSAIVPGIILVIAGMNVIVLFARDNGTSSSSWAIFFGIVLELLGIVILSSTLSKPKKD